VSASSPTPEHQTGQLPEQWDGGEAVVAIRGQHVRLHATERALATAVLTFTPDEALQLAQLLTVAALKAARAGQ
jgi:hypothetical protein